MTYFSMLSQACKTVDASEKKEERKKYNNQNIILGKLGLVKYCNSNEKRGRKDQNFSNRQEIP